MDKIGIIYKYTSPSGKSYIGQTTDESKRKISHKRQRNTKFSWAIEKYGFENFTYKVLFKTKPTRDLVKLKNILNNLEIAFISYYDSFNCGYNLTKGGEGCLGNKQTIESLEKRKTSRRLNDPFWGDKLWLLEKESKRKERLEKRVIKEQLKKEKSLLRLEHKKKKESTRVVSVKSPIILQLDFNNNIIQEWKNPFSIKKSLNLDPYHIKECCLLKRCSEGGFRWRFKIN